MIAGNADGHEKTPYLDVQTLVLIPSISLGVLTSRYLKGLHFFEERNLYYLSRLSHPENHFLVVLSEGVDPSYLEYCYRQLISAVGLEATVIDKKFAVVTVKTRGRKALAKALLDDKNAFERLKTVLSEYPNPVLDFWVVTSDEVELADQLGVQYKGQPRNTLGMDSKSSSRTLFARAGVPTPKGYAGVYTLNDVRDKLRRLSRETDAKSFLIKIESEEAGNGIAEVDRIAIGFDLEGFVSGVSVAKSEISKLSFAEQLYLQGGIVEEKITAEEVASPSVMMEVLPDGTVRNLATHDQTLHGLSYAGAKFPAASQYRNTLIDYGYRIANLAAADGVRGLISADFVAIRSGSKSSWDVLGIEVNMRKGATTHPYYWTKTLTQACYDEATGHLIGRNGLLGYYASEFFSVPDLSNVRPKTILSALERASVGFSADRQSGVFVHMVSCVPILGKLGATVIGHSDDEIEYYRIQFIDFLKNLAN